MARGKKKMSVKEMQAEVTRLQKQIKVAEQQVLLKEIVGSQEFKTLARKFSKLGKTPEEIAGLFATAGKTAGAAKSAKKTRAKAPPKFQHPKNPELKWTGRGNKPNWVKECLANGLTMEQLLIQK